VAIKILDKQKIKDQSDLERINREIKILKKLRHPHVVQLFDVSPPPKQIKKAAPPYLAVITSCGFFLLEVLALSQLIAFLDY
jgi:serine/threonine protein kinase